MKTSPSYLAAKENILLNDEESRRRIASELGARGALQSGQFVGRLENLERGTNQLLNSAYMTEEDVARAERTNRINMALQLLTGNLAGSATSTASVAGSLSAGAKEPAQAPAGGGVSSLGQSFMLQSLMKKLFPSTPGSGGFASGMGVGSSNPGAYTEPFWWGTS